jgi:hypothetical protein
MTMLAALPLSLPITVAAILVHALAPAIGACLVGGWICARVMR